MESSWPSGKRRLCLNAELLVRARYAVIGGYLSLTTEREETASAKHMGYKYYTVPP